MSLFLQKHFNHKLISQGQNSALQTLKSAHHDIATIPNAGDTFINRITKRRLMDTTLFRVQFSASLYISSFALYHIQVVTTCHRFHFSFCLPVAVQRKLPGSLARCYSVMRILPGPSSSRKHLPHLRNISARSHSA